MWQETQHIVEWKKETDFYMYIIFQLYKCIPRNTSAPWEWIVCLFYFFSLQFKQWATYFLENFAKIKQKQPILHLCLAVSHTIHYSFFLFSQPPCFGVYHSCGTWRVSQGTHLPPDDHKFLKRLNCLFCNATCFEKLKTICEITKCMDVCLKHLLELSCVSLLSQWVAQLLVWRAKWVLS